ncbi:hypothetical protein D3C77_624350 [compost metagenome]
MHQVRFTQAYAAIQEQWVVAMLGIIGDLPGGRAGQLVGLTLYEVLEGKGAVQVAGVLKRTFDLHRACFGATTWRRGGIGLAHRIKAVTRRRVLDLGYRRGGNRCLDRLLGHGSLCCLGLGGSGSRCQWRIGGGTRRRTASAAY